MILAFVIMCVCMLMLLVFAFDDLYIKQTCHVCLIYKSWLTSDTIQSILWLLSPNTIILLILSSQEKHKIEQQDKWASSHYSIHFKSKRSSFWTSKKQNPWLHHQSQLN